MKYIIETLNNIITDLDNTINQPQEIRTVYNSLAEIKDRLEQVTDEIEQVEDRTENLINKLSEKVVANNHKEDGIIKVAEDYLGKVNTAIIQKQDYRTTQQLLELALMKIKQAARVRTYKCDECLTEVDEMVAIKRERDYQTEEKIVCFDCNESLDQLDRLDIGQNI